MRALFRRGPRPAPRPRPLCLFRGFLRCADCGKAMSRSQVKGMVYYFCRTYKDQSKTACTKHSVKHNRLEAAVLYAIQQQVYLAVHYANTLEYISTAPLQKSQSIRIEALIDAKEKERYKIMRYKQSIYQDWKDGNLTQKDYRQMYDGYEQQIVDINSAIQALKAERSELEKGGDMENPFLSAYRKYENIDRLTRDILIELVDHIKVFENGSISVKLKHSDDIRRIQEYIQVNRHSEAG
ncbi:hypothetical protein CG709_10505 [Lachnotalea glycerini]|nr:hypothetical protein CG709_10505 [Lachnotalea glycerini]